MINYYVSFIENLRKTQGIPLINRLANQKEILIKAKQKEYSLPLCTFLFSPACPPGWPEHPQSCSDVGRGPRAHLWQVFDVAEERKAEGVAVAFTAHVQKHLRGFICGLQFQKLMCPRWEANGQALNQWKSKPVFELLV